MADNQYPASNRIKVLLDYLHEHKMNLENLAEKRRTKLEQCVQLTQFRIDANQVSWMRQTVFFFFLSKWINKIFKIKN